MGAVFLVIERRRLQETADYPMYQQTGYDAGGHVPEENIQWDLLSGRSRGDDNTNGQAGAMWACERRLAFAANTGHNHRRGCGDYGLYTRAAKLARFDLADG